MAKQVYDLHAGKGFSRGQSTEHLRNYRVIDPEAKKYGYYDPTRMHLNFEVTTGGKVVPVNKSYDINRRFKDNLKRRGIKDPNEEKIKKGLTPNRNTIANIILGGSRDRMLELAFGDQKYDLAKGADNSHLQRKEDIEKWAVEIYNWAEKNMEKRTFWRLLFIWTRRIRMFIVLLFLLMKKEEFHTTKSLVVQKKMQGLSSMRLMMKLPLSTKNGT